MRVPARNDHEHDVGDGRRHDHDHPCQRRRIMIEICQREMRRAPSNHVKNEVSRDAVRRVVENSSEVGRECVPRIRNRLVSAESVDCVEGKTDECEDDLEKGVDGEH